MLQIYAIVAHCESPCARYGSAGVPQQSDCYGAPLTFSGGSSDVVALGNIGLAFR